MKNRASLLLMEQLVMVLVFALAAVLCLGVFARAELIAQQTERRDEAVRIAQSAAEQLKAGQWPEQSQNGYWVHVLQTEGDTPGLSVAIISVHYEKKQLFSLTTAWQEVLQ